MKKSKPSVSLESFGYTQELRRSLTTCDLIIYALLFMVPIAPFGIYGIVATLSQGMVALVYLIGLSGMLFTAFSYWRMAEVFPLTGSVYAYTSKGINKEVGFLCGWLMMLDYLLIPAFLYMVSSAALNSIAPYVPVFAWVIFFVVINTVINMLGIKLTAKINKVILTLELIVLCIFLGAAILTIINSGGVSFNFNPLYNSENFDLDMIMVAVSVAVLSFVGFDGVSALAEETKGGTESVGKSCVYALLIAGALFIVQTFAAALVWPDFGSFDSLDMAFYQVAYAAGGPFVMWLCAVATGLAWGIANSMVAQTSLSRVLYSMARDGLLPRSFAKIHPKHQTPYVAILFIAVLSLVISLLFSGDVSVLSMLVNFGALTSFLIINFTVIYYFIYKKKSKHYFKHLIMPTIGFLIVAFVWLHLNRYAKTLGFVWLVLGLIILLVVKFVMRRNMDLEI